MSEETRGLGGRHHNTWTWEPYEPNGSTDYVTPDRWDKDHWSTLAYLETRVVDHGGVIHNAHMRCHLRLHRVFAHNVPGASVGAPIDGSDCPTRLKAGEKLERHDDWSCLEDAAAAGFIEAEFRQRYSGEIVGSHEARVRFTPRGLEVAAALRAHKANGGSFGEFVLPVEAVLVVREVQR